MVEENETKITNIFKDYYQKSQQITHKEILM